MTEWFYNPLKGQPRYVDVYHLRNMAASEWVHMCTSTIIEEVCQVPWELVPKRPELRESPPEQLLWQIEDQTEFFNRCNENKETLTHILRALLRDSLELDASCLVKGFSERSYERVPEGGFILRPRGQRELVELFARDGGSFMKETDVNGIERRFWQYSYLHPAVAPIEFDTDEIAYGTRYPRSYSVYGWSELQSMETILNCLINSAFTNATMFQEYAVPSGVISFQGSLEDERRLKEYFTTEIKGRFHKVAVLNKDATFTPITMSNRDMDFINMQKWFSRLCWALYKLTPTELGFQDEIRETGKAMAAQSKLQKRKAVMPALKLIEIVINTQVLNEFTDDLIFQFQYTDKEEEYAWDELSLQQLDRGLVTINELRKRRKMGAPVGWGDLPFQLTLAGARPPAMGAPPGQQSLGETDMQDNDMGKQVWGGRSTEEYDFRTDIPQNVRALNPSSGRYEPVKIGNKFDKRELEKAVNLIEKSFQYRLQAPRKKPLDPYEVHLVQNQIARLKAAIGKIGYPMGALGPMGTKPDPPSRDGMLLPGEQKPRDVEKPLGPNQTPAPYRTGPYDRYRGGEQPSNEFAGGHGAHRWERDNTNMRVKPSERTDPRGLAPPRKPTVPYLDTEYQIVPTPKIPVGPKYPRDVPPVHGATGMPRKPLTDEEEGDQVDEFTPEGVRPKGWVTIGGRPVLIGEEDEDGAEAGKAPKGTKLEGTYYRGSTDGKYREFSYFTKEQREAQVYAEAKGGKVSEHDIKAQNALKANDIWHAGKKLGIPFDRDKDDPTKVRLQILNTAKKQGYDAIDMDTWTVAIKPDVVKETRILKTKMTPPLPSMGGGKYRQVKFLRSIMPEKLGLYVEPFAGGAALFFGLPEKPMKAVLNDKDPSFPTLWRWIQQATPEQIEDLKARPWTAERDDFFRAKDEFKPRSLLDRIWQILYVTRHSFRNNRRTWRGEDRKGTHRNGMPQWINRIDQYRERLQGATIENKDWKEVMQEHDGPDTFFYIDPPYEQEFARQLPAVLDRTKGKWLLSFGEDETLQRELEKRGFHVKALNVTNMINKPDAATRTMRQEMLAANYPLEFDGDVTFKFVDTDISMKQLFFSEGRVVTKGVHDHEQALSDRLKLLIRQVHTGALGKEQAAIEAKAAIDHHILQGVKEATESAVARQLKKEQVTLPPEAMARIERQAAQHMEDFMRILGDAENAQK
jgi:DNA adenine methylase